MLSMREKNRGRERERVSRQTRFIYCQDNRVSASPVSSLKIAEIDFSWGTWFCCGKNMKKNTQAMIAPGRLLVFKWNSTCSILFCCTTGLKTGHLGVGRYGIVGNTSFTCIHLLKITINHDWSDKTAVGGGKYVLTSVDVRKWSQSALCSALLLIWQACHSVQVMRYAEVQSRLNEAWISIILNTANLPADAPAFKVFTSAL